MADGFRRRSMIPASDDIKGNFSNQMEAHPTATRKPEGGFGWFVVLAAFIVHVIIDGRLYCMGALLPALIEKFENQTTQSSWVMSLFVATVLGSGPLSSAIDNTLGHIWTAFIGGVIATLGTVATIYATKLWHVILSFGIVAGTGMGMTYLVSVVVISEWFHEKKALAMGIVVCGTGLGTFAFNYGYTALYHELHWQGLFAVLAGVAAISCIIAPLLRSPKEIQNINANTFNLDPVPSQASIPITENTLEDALAPWPPKNAWLRTTLQNLKNTAKSTFSLDVLKNRAFLIYMLTDFIISVSMFIPYDFLVVRVQQELPELNEKLAALMPSILGVATIFGQLASGLLSIPRVHQAVNYVSILTFIVITQGTTAALSAFCRNYTDFAIYAAATGFLDGVIHTLTPVVNYEIAGEELFISAWGFQMFLQGIGCMAGPVIAGAMIDYFGPGNFWKTFVIFGCNLIFGGLILLPVPLSSRLSVFHWFSVPKDDTERQNNMAVLWMTSRRTTPRSSLGLPNNNRELRRKSCIPSPGRRDQIDYVNAEAQRRNRSV